MDSTAVQRIWQFKTGERIHGSISHPFRVWPTLYVLALSTIRLVKGSAIRWFIILIIIPGRLPCHQPRIQHNFPKKHLHQWARYLDCSSLCLYFWCSDAHLDIQGSIDSGVTVSGIVVAGNTIINRFVMRSMRHCTRHYPLRTHFVTFKRSSTSYQDPSVCDWEHSK